MRQEMVTHPRGRIWEH